MLLIPKNVLLSMSYIGFRLMSFMKYFIGNYDLKKYIDESLHIKILWLPILKIWLLIICKSLSHSLESLAPVHSEFCTDDGKPIKIYAIVTNNYDYDCKLHHPISMYWIVSIWNGMTHESLTCSVLSTNPIEYGYILIDWLVAILSVA